MYCTADLLASLDYMHGRFGSTSFVVIGWSFGGAPCFTAADKDERIVGVATVASQTTETFGITRLAPRPVLLMHGTGDNILSHMCAKRLYEMYGDDLGEKTLKLFDGDDHGLTQNANEVERMLFEFVQSAFEMELENAEAVAIRDHDMTGDWRQRVEAMKTGGDLNNGEAL